MVEFLNFLFNPEAIYDLATAHSFEFWISMGINIILSTLIGGIILSIILEIFGHKFGENVSVKNAFLVVLIVNLINMFGFMGLLLPFVVAIPFGNVILPLLVWIVFIKLFFGDLSLVHSIAVALIFYVITLFFAPIIVGYLGGFLGNLFP
mgnify:CR=1 FL=1